MTAKSVLVRPQGLRPRARAPTFPPNPPCYATVFNHSKVEAIPLSALPKDTTSELAGISLHYSFFAEHQAGKL